MFWLQLFLQAVCLHTKLNLKNTACQWTDIRIQVDSHNTRLHTALPASQGSNREFKPVTAHSPREVSGNKRLLLLTFSTQPHAFFLGERKTRGRRVFAQNAFFTSSDCSLITCQDSVYFTGICSATTNERKASLKQVGTHTEISQYQNAKSSIGVQIRCNRGKDLRCLASC